MFTGLIETTGIVEEIRPGEKSILIGIRPHGGGFDVPVGGSVAVNGACLTLEYRSGGSLFFTAVQETLGRSTLAKARRGELVNLERALSASGRLDGHIVLGHVDAVGLILADRKAGDSIVRSIGAPESIAQFIAEKGSVAIDGVSLTVSRCGGNDFEISLIPHTLEKTTMWQKRPGDEVNIEFDVLARYIARMLGRRSAEGVNHTGQGGRGSLMDALERSGF